MTSLSIELYRKLEDFGCDNQRATSHDARKSIFSLQFPFRVFDENWDDKSWAAEVACMAQIVWQM